MKNKSAKINWATAIYLASIPLVCAILWPIYIRYVGAPSLGLVIYFFIHWGVEFFCITGGYHRMFSHRSYKVSKLVEIFYLVVGAGAFQNSVVVWATEHRIHHREVDSPRDPYSISKGFLWAHLLWMIFTNDNINVKKIPNDLKDSKMIMWQYRYYLPLAISVGFLLPTFVGWIMGDALGGFLLGAATRLFCSNHCTNLINSAAHTWGKRPFSVLNTARDNWVLALFTFGEGFHNFHHKFQADYRNGVRWYHYDPTKWIIWTLQKLRLASDLNVTPDQKITQARLSNV